MLKAIRYTLVAICLAASMGCLALWLYGRLTSWCTTVDIVHWPAFVHVTIERGRSLVNYQLHRGLANLPMCAVNHYYRMPDSATFEGTTVTKQELAACGDFGLVRNNLLFPLWYPAIVFAVAAVAAIRIGRQFTLRSALVGMSVVAALLGMVVAL